MRRLSDRIQGTKEGHWGKKGKMILKQFSMKSAQKSSPCWSVYSSFALQSFTVCCCDTTPTSLHLQ